MKYLVIFLTLFLSISKYQCEYASCRTNCSTNGTFDDECWRQALTYQSAELVERLFSFSSLSVHVDTFQRKHSSQLNDSIKFIDTALNNHLLNESKDAKLNMNLFTETKQILINFCRNLTSQPVTDVRQIPSLVCSAHSCSGDIRNYVVLFIISIAICSVTLIICIVQSIKIRRRRNPRSIVIANNAVPNSPATAVTTTDT
ncbi:unnamed protein product [Rotaria socialis]|uniref:Uncharacterized protein n=1 Tax=Rotaria socialis TaxID=392032 RepID=A0A819YC34_9BILA|nr:unnamed protein product [Rotaria socialis]CAF3305303.1 unnamed protein product [Rotaria socialis]CAF3402024.1 unnamed protein product [Rotaria socialis]CAF3409778.1 unnamed protein product [Rotaria socialis]CAF3702227.1 unnamed protein product [Rotaria socialis]